MLRLKSFAHFANSYNPTWDNFNIVFWSTVEVCIGLICCCLPTFRLILVKLWPRVFETRSSRTRTSCTASSSNAIRSTCRTQRSSTAEYDELDDAAHHARAKWTPAREADPREADHQEDDLETGGRKVRIRPLKRLPSEEDCFELTRGAAKAAEKTPGA
ncbi:hypothetical protein E4U53_001146 [Claviceps sorghi]|nr:hypothetical protein E4U53_001146 [Claviceps sorghi]